MKKSYELKRYAVVRFLNGNADVVNTLLPNNDKLAVRYAEVRVPGEILKVTPKDDEIEHITLEMPDDVFETKAVKLSADKRRNMVSRTMTSTAIDCIAWDGEKAERTVKIVPSKLNTKQAAKVEDVLKVFSVDFITELVGVPDAEFFDWCMDNR